MLPIKNNHNTTFLVEEGRVVPFPCCIDRFNRWIQQVYSSHNHRINTLTSTSSGTEHSRLHDSNCLNKYHWKRMFACMHAAMGTKWYPCGVKGREKRNEKLATSMPRPTMLFIFFRPSSRRLPCLQSRLLRLWKRNLFLPPPRRFPNGNHLKEYLLEFPSKKASRIVDENSSEFKFSQWTFQRETSPTKLGFSLMKSKSNFLSLWKDWQVQTLLTDWPRTIWKLIIKNVRIELSR